MFNLKTASLGAAFILAASWSLAGEALDRVMESKTLTVATDPAWPPQSFLNDNQEMDGFDVDVAREIARRLGVGVEFVTPDWSLITGGRWAGRWDISVGSMTPTPARAEVLQFPAIYYYVPASAAVHNDSDAKTIADLNGRKIGVSAGSTWEEYLKHELVISAIGAPEFEYQITPGELQSFDASAFNVVDQLRIGDGVRIEGMVDSLSALNNAIAEGYPIRVVGDPLFYEPLAVAIDLGDEAFNGKVAGIIAGMKADGTLKGLSEKWYGTDYTSTK
ncbi:amino acid ABC transporter substrate-binding protein [Leisingera sp. ANG-M1]|uniref:transporter substrate-binding domain-containing protein n=1 Tax=Leisingera sp. ANG-M1 TaxID=1577895 RepID=UPI00057F3558|nr:transporter substrate-binding domain-containing protein [Leisingera sp. ANG-M1]KIC11629.1 amino acid ABC transporter substrate-binding protein [Leisingera sp. ANG-M1]